MTDVRWAARADDWAIRCTDLVKRYGGREVLRGLNLNVPRGGVHGLLGPNGSGKTTSIRVILGLTRANAGHAEILGQRVPEALPRVISQVGAIVESPKFAPRMTGRQNLLVLGAAIGVDRRRITEVLLEVSLDDHAEIPYRAYSLGQRQRLAIAATLLKRPEVLIFDEPTNGLDPVGIHDIRATMRSLADSGRTVLVSSHILSEIEQIADSLSVIVDGRVVAESDIESFLSGGEPHVRIGIGDRVEAMDVLRRAGWRVEFGDGELRVLPRAGVELDPAGIARTLGEEGLWPYELVAQRQSLEQVFLELTSGAADWKPDPEGWR